jgi:hypothetical protein
VNFSHIPKFGILGRDMHILFLIDACSCILFCD